MFTQHTVPYETYRGSRRSSAEPQESEFVESTHFLNSFEPQFRYKIGILPKLFTDRGRAKVPRTLPSVRRTHMVWHCQFILNWHCQSIALAERPGTRRSSRRVWTLQRQNFQKGTKVAKENPAGTLGHTRAKSCAPPATQRKGQSRNDKHRWKQQHCSTISRNLIPRRRCKQIQPQTQQGLNEVRSAAKDDQHGETATDPEGRDVERASVQFQDR